MSETAKPTSLEIGTLTIKTDGIYLTTTGEILDAVSVYNRLRMHASEVLDPETIEESNSGTSEDVSSNTSSSTETITEELKDGTSKKETSTTETNSKPATENTNSTAGEKTKAK